MINAAKIYLLFNNSPPLKELREFSYGEREQYNLCLFIYIQCITAC